MAHLRSRFNLPSLLLYLASLSLELLSFGKQPCSFNLIFFTLEFGRCFFLFAKKICFFTLELFAFKTLFFDAFLSFSQLFLPTFFFFLFLIFHFGLLLGLECLQFLLLTLQILFCLQDTFLFLALALLILKLLTTTIFFLLLPSSLLLFFNLRETSYLLSSKSLEAFCFHFLKIFKTFSFFSLETRKTIAFQSLKLRQPCFLFFLKTSPSTVFLAEQSFLPLLLFPLNSQLALLLFANKSLFTNSFFCFELGAASIVFSDTLLTFLFFESQLLLSLPFVLLEALLPIEFILLAFQPLFFKLGGPLLLLSLGCCGSAFSILALETHSLSFLLFLSETVFSRDLLLTEAQFFGISFSLQTRSFFKLESIELGQLSLNFRIVLLCLALQSSLLLFSSF